MMRDEEGGNQLGRTVECVGGKMVARANVAGARILPGSVLPKTETPGSI